MRKILFAGTFDPPTKGHLDLIERGAKLCDELWVGVAEENSKERSLFSANERKVLVADIVSHLPNVHVEVFSGLAVNFAVEKEILNLLRGLRGASDSCYEFQMAQTNQVIGGIETVFLMANPIYLHISSSLIREIGRSGRRLHEFVPEAIEEIVFQRIIG